MIFIKNNFFFFYNIKGFVHLTHYGQDSERSHMTSAILVSIGAGIGLSPIWHQLIISAYAAWIILKI